jgi:hypothetical protein
MKKHKTETTAKRSPIRLDRIYRVAFQEWMASNGYTKKYKITTALSPTSTQKDCINAAAAFVMNNDQIEKDCIVKARGCVVFHPSGSRRDVSYATLTPITVLFDESGPVAWSPLAGLYLGSIPFGSRWKSDLAAEWQPYRVRVTGQRPKQSIRFGAGSYVETLPEEVA